MGSTASSHTAHRTLDPGSQRQEHEGEGAHHQGLAEEKQGERVRSRRREAAPQDSGQFISKCIRPKTKFP